LYLYIPYQYSFSLSVLSKLDKLQSSMGEIKKILLGKSGLGGDLEDQDRIESLLPDGRRLNSVDKMLDVEGQLEDGAFRKKPVCITNT